MRAILLSVMLGMGVGMQSTSGIEMLKPPQIWEDYDPNMGDFEEKVFKEWEQDGNHFRDSYISAYVNGEKIRVYCIYAFPKGATKTPAILFVHGWMGAPGINRDFLKMGYAIMTYDYCGKTGNRPEYTQYPDALKHGNMERPQVCFQPCPVMDCRLERIRSVL